MKYVAREQIIDLFKDPQDTMENGLWFSGYYGEGEYKAWYSNGRLSINCYYKNREKDGEYKAWLENGKLYFHKLYKNGQVVKDYLE